MKNIKKENKLINKLTLKLMAIASSVIVVTTGAAGCAKTSNQLFNPKVSNELTQQLLEESELESVEKENGLIEHTCQDVIRDLEIDDSYLTKKTSISVTDSKKFYNFLDTLDENDPEYIMKISAFVKENGTASVKRTKLAHNNGEPIYVCIDGLDEYGKDCAISALDYFFETLSSINSNYHYQLVDSSTLNKKYRKENKTVINISTGKFTDVAGKCEEFIGTTLKNVELYNRLDIQIAKNIKSKYENGYSSVILHELTHGAGWDDVYAHDLEVENATTFINTGLGDCYSKYTVNDMKCFYLNYDEELYKEMTQEDYEDKIDEIKVTLDNYETEYNYGFCDDYINFTRTINERTGFEEPNLDIVGTRSVLRSYGDGTEEKVTYTYRIKTDENGYTLSLSGQNGEEYGTATGKYVFRNGCILLKDVNLPFGTNPTEVHAYAFKGDIVISKFDDKIILETFCEMWDAFILKDVQNLAEIELSV